jgi:Cys-rich protein (TIGR01571 family)
VKAGATFRGLVVQKVLLAKSESSKEQTSPFEIPTGQWRDGICDCCTHGVCHAQLCFTFCFGAWALGQVMTRLNLNALGKPARTRLRGLTSPFYILGLVVVTASFVVIPYYISLLENISLMENPSQQPSLAFMLILYPAVIYMLVLHTRTRNLLRRKYKIGTSYGCIGDCCCAYWCGCCSMCQMARHTADYRHHHKARCCSETGLDDDVEPLVPYVTSSSSVQIV